MCVEFLSHIRARGAKLGGWYLGGNWNSLHIQGPLWASSCSGNRFPKPPCPHPKVGSGLPLGFHSFPTAVCGPHLPPPLHGKLLESSDHLHLHVSRAQHRSWHRATVGGTLIIAVQTNLHAVGCHRREWASCPRRCISRPLWPMVGGGRRDSFIQQLSSGPSQLWVLAFQDLSYLQGGGSAISSYPWVQGFSRNSVASSEEVSGGCADLSRWPFPHELLSPGATTQA